MQKRTDKTISYLYTYIEINSRKVLILTYASYLGLPLSLDFNDTIY